MPRTPNYDKPVAGNILGDLVKFDNSNGIAIADIVAVSTEDQVIDNFFIVSDDTAAKELWLYAKKGTVEVKIAVFTVPIQAGDIVGTPAVDIINYGNNSKPFMKVDGAGKYYMDLPAGWSLRGRLAAVTTAGKFVTVGWIGGNYAVPA